MNGIIYKAISPSGKVYIGQTIRTLERRKKIHANIAKNGSPTKFAHAIRKYGIKNFKWKILHSDVAETKINQLEQLEINKHNSFINGYNGTLGGNDAGFRGKTHSLKTKKLLSKIRRGKNNPMFGQKERANPFYGKKHTRKTRKQMSENHADISGDKNPMSYKSIMKRYKCTFEKAKEIRRKLLCRETIQ